MPLLVLMPPPTATATAKGPRSSPDHGSAPTGFGAVHGHPDALVLTALPPTQPCAYVAVVPCQKARPVGAAVHKRPIQTAPGRLMITQQPSQLAEIQSHRSRRRRVDEDATCKPPHGSG